MTANFEEVVVYFYRQKPDNFNATNCWISQQLLLDLATSILPTKIPVINYYQHLMKKVNCILIGNRISFLLLHASKVGDPRRLFINITNPPGPS